MKYISYFSFMLLLSCSNNIRQIKPTIYKEGFDVVGILNINDKIILSANIKPVVWRLTKVDFKSAVFINEKGSEIEIFNTGFLPGSIITRFKRQNRSVLFFPNEI